MKNLLIKLRPSSDGKDADVVISNNKGKLKKTIKHVDIKVIEFPNENAAQNALKGLKHSKDVLFAEEDKVIPPDLIPNDPYYSAQWHLPAINAPAAWDVTTGSPDIIIAILDTGVNPHVDFEDRLLPGFNTNDNSTDTSDVYGHGTKVAGVAAAVGNNGLSVAGIAWNCKILPVRVSGVDGNGSYADISEGLVWAADNGARVANISYDASASLSIASSAQYFQNNGGVVVIAAGNTNTVRNWPGNYSFLVVSGTNSDGTKASFSNTGSNIDLAAPAVGITTTSPGGGESQASGTSFAAPIVSGVAGLLLSQNPGLSGQDARLTLRQSGADYGTPGWDAIFGAGIIDAFSALQPKTLNYPPTATITSHVNGETVRNVETIQISYNDDIGVVKAELFVAGVLTNTSTTAPFSTSWNVKPISSGSYQVQVVVYDALHNAGLSQILTLVKR